ncbi:NAM domain-containing protein, partial [Cephalotus follicularis]
YFKSFPVGYYFRPSDEELIIHYLKNKIWGKPLPPNRIFVVDLCDYNPEVLTALYTLLPRRETEWYFLSSRRRKYLNGQRPDRKAGNGYWKPTGTDKVIKNGNQVIGCKKSLDYNEGKQPNGKRTNWKMHEYRLDSNSMPSGCTGNRDAMKLDDWVLCKIYK